MLRARSAERLAEAAPEMAPPRRLVAERRPRGWGMLLRAIIAARGAAGGCTVGGVASRSPRAHRREHRRMRHPTGSDPSQRVQGGE
eukprot:36047-Pleurochrysis_carterae.AAC.1